MMDLRYSQPKLLLYSIFAAIGIGFGFATLGGFIPAQLPMVVLIVGPLMILGFGFAAYHLLDTAFGDLKVVQIGGGQVRVTTIFDRYVFPVGNIDQIGIEIVEGDGTKDQCVVIRTKDRVKNEREWFPWSSTRKIILTTRMMESFDAGQFSRLRGASNRSF